MGACPTCGAAIQDANSRFCPSCGSPLPTQQPPGATGAVSGVPVASPNHEMTVPISPQPLIGPSSSSPPPPQQQQQQNLTISPAQQQLLQRLQPGTQQLLMQRASQMMQTTGGRQLMQRASQMMQTMGGRRMHQRGVLGVGGAPTVPGRIIDEYVPSGEPEPIDEELERILLQKNPTTCRGMGISFLVLAFIFPLVIFGGFSGMFALVTSESTGMWYIGLAIGGPVALVIGVALLIAGIVALCRAKRLGDNIREKQRIQEESIQEQEREYFAAVAASDFPNPQTPVYFTERKNETARFVSMFRMGEKVYRDQIAAVQTQLFGVTDGDFGTRTHKKVCDFQRRVGMRVSGVVGPETWYRLFKEEKGLEKAREGVPRMPDQLGQGSTGDAVFRMQIRLEQHGFKVGSEGPDGTYGVETQSALQLFCQQRGIVGGGIGFVTSQVWNELFKETPLDRQYASLPKTPGGMPLLRELRRGAKGPDVTAVQERMKSKFQILGVGLVADGDFGARTERAVRLLQENEGLDVDGWIGPETWTRLFEADAKLGEQQKNQFNPHEWVNCPKTPDGLSPTRVLQSGCTGDDVFALQIRLEHHGIKVGMSGPDGTFGPTTDAAVRQFQQQRGIATSGFSFSAVTVNSQLWTELFRQTERDRQFATLPKTPDGRPYQRELRRGAQGPDVTVVQERMQQKFKILGVGLIADGDFGPRTERAVRLLQERQGLDVDGWIGPHTWTRLFEADVGLGEQQGQQFDSREWYGCPKTPDGLSPARILKAGCSGDDVFAVQIRLEHHGFSLGLGGPTGTFDPITENALRQFKQQKAISSNGFEFEATTVTPQIWKALFSETPLDRQHAGLPRTPEGRRYQRELRRGAKGPDVTAVQERMKGKFRILGIGLIADGDFGPRTERAVRLLQEQQGLTVDGWIGTETWTRLFQAEIVAPPPVSPPLDSAPVTPSTRRNFLFLQDVVQDKANSSSFRLSGGGSLLVSSDGQSLFCAGQQIRLEDVQGYEIDRAASTVGETVFGLIVADQFSGKEESVPMKMESSVAKGFFGQFFEED